MSTIQVKFFDSWVCLTLSRPEALNALNRSVIEELSGHLQVISQNKKMRALVLTGAGEKAFVAGADIKEMENMSAGEAEAMAIRGQSVLTFLENMPLVSIAAVNGFALGGGMELAMACDFMIASQNAKFGLPEVSLGLMPGYGGTQRLARSIGINNARMLTLTGDMITADRAREWGLVSEVVPQAELMACAEKWAKLAASRSPEGVRRAKNSILMGIEKSLADGLLIEAKNFAQCFAHVNRHEGVTAFIEKRKPQFS